MLQEDTNVPIVRGFQNSQYESKTHGPLEEVQADQISLSWGN